MLHNDNQREQELENLQTRLGNELDEYFNPWLVIGFNYEEGDRFMLSSELVKERDIDALIGLLESAKAEIQNKVFEQSLMDIWAGHDNDEMFDVEEED